MSRFASLAIVLLTVVFVGLASPALGRQALEQPSGSGGLGNTRTDLDLAYGAAERTNVTDHGDYAISSSSYEDEWVFFLLNDNTTPSPDDRAIIVHRYADVDAGSSFTYPEATAIANQLLPSDAVPTSDLLPYEFPPPFEGPAVDHRQSFFSESITHLFPNPDLYRGGEPGTVWLILTLDYGVADPGSQFVRVEVRLDEP